MELVAFVIVAAFLILSFIIQNMTQEKEIAAFMAIQLAKNGYRFPCRFVKEFYGYTLSDYQRARVREIVTCEVDCVDCLADLQPKVEANNIFPA
uniref:Uncharacterized protein n=1 Tax=Archaeoglobus fulgidus TaxID=2234 RepID=A0A7J3M1Z2_ARCFL